MMTPHASLFMYDVKLVESWKIILITPCYISVLICMETETLETLFIKYMLYNCLLDVNIFNAGQVG